MTTEPSKEKKKFWQRDEPKPTVIFRTDDGWQTRTEIAADHIVQRSFLRERLRAIEEFVNNGARLLGDRFMQKPEVLAFTTTMVTDLKLSWGGGIAEKEPRGLQNLNSAEWFFQEYAESRMNCTIRNVTSKTRKEWDADTGSYKDFAPGDIIRYGEDNPWVVKMGLYCLRILHHNAVRTISQLEGRPQNVIPKDFTTEPRPSWEQDSNKTNPPPRTPMPQ